MPDVRMVHCEISGEEMPAFKAYNAQFLRQQLFDLIHAENPKITRQSILSPEVVNAYREKYIKNLLSEASGELSNLQNQVISSIQTNQILSEPLPANIKDNPTLPDKIGDFIADWGGSWPFILIFFFGLVGWIITNTILLSGNAVDPYPFEMLNLFLTMLAAVQAPVLIMSQKRREGFDRRRAENDYKVNLKSELEIKLLHEKLDHIIVHQHQQLLELEEVQREYLKDILKKFDTQQ